MPEEVKYPKQGNGNTFRGFNNPKEGHSEINPKLNIDVGLCFGAFQHGVIILADNDPDAHYYYLVTVITGWKGGSGTTSTVAMCMTGTKGTSDRHLLESPGIIIHETGSENWFLLATPEWLGNLTQVCVWHSCSGLYPDW